MASTPRDLDSAGWASCPEGDLQNLGRKLRGTARRRQAVGPALAGGAALVLACVVVASGWQSPGGISCEACVSRFAAYNDYLAALDAAQPGQPAPEADATLVEVKQHLAGCPSCRDAFQRAYPTAVLETAALGAGVTLALLTFGIVRLRESRSNVWPTGP